MRNNERTNDQRSEKDHFLLLDRPRYLSFHFQSTEEREIRRRIVSLLGCYGFSIIENTSTSIIACIKGYEEHQAPGDREGCSDYQGVPFRLSFLLGESEIPVSDSLTDQTHFFGIGYNPSREPAIPSVVLPSRGPGLIHSSDLLYYNGVRCILDGLYLHGILGYDYIDMKSIIQGEGKFILGFGTSHLDEQRALNQTLDMLNGQGLIWEDVQGVLMGAGGKSGIHIIKLNGIARRLENLLIDDADMALYNFLLPECKNEVDVRILASIKPGQAAQ